MEFQQPLRPYQKSKKSQKQTQAEGVSNLAGTPGSQFAEPIVYVRGSQQKRKVANHLKFMYI